jgi:hypothetical protein
MVSDLLDRCDARADERGDQVADQAVVVRPGNDGDPGFAGEVLEYPLEVELLA